MNFDGKIYQSYTSKAIFMRLNIINPLPHKITRILYLDHMLTGNVELFDGKTVQESGSSKVVNNRAIDSVFTAFKIKLMANEIKTIYLRKKSNHIFNTKVLLTSEQNFKLMEAMKFNVFRFYTGAILALLLYNLLLAIFIKDKNYYYYSGFILSLFITVVAVKGMMDSVQIFSFRTPSHYLTCFLSLSLVIAILFTKRLIPTTKNYPVFGKVFKAQIILAIIPLIACLLPFFDELIWVFGHYINILIIVSLITMTTYGFLSARKKDPLALIYTISWFSIFVGIVVHLLPIYGICDKNWISSNSILMGNVLQMLILSLGLGYKVIALSREKDEAMSRASSKERYQKLLRVLSHDVSNSLQVIQISLKRLGRGLRHDQNKDKVNRLLIVAENMRSILDNVKKEQKLELDKEQIVLEHVDLIECLKKSLMIYEDRIHDKNLILKLNLSQKIPKIKSEEVSLINNVLGNIISNSIKFSPKGGEIQIKVNKENDLIHMCISDEGAGFSDHLFENFENDGNILSTLGTDGEEGTGFGMKIIKSYIELYNGKILLSNDNGAEFHLFFNAV